MGSYIGKVFLPPILEEERYMAEYGQQDLSLAFSGKKYRVKHIIVLQRFYKRNKRYFSFQKLIKSEAFISWLYHPLNVGGKLAKRSITSFINNML